ncbi:MAG: bifunctional MaoC family dehydratase N-terminal/OB-fold nucleic acid binding domain-containing protein [Acidimicrobiales bacterium]
MTSPDPTFVDQLRACEGMTTGPIELSHDPVNVPMIRHWCHAIGDTNPIYLDAQAAAASIHGQIIAPPAMLQAWTMRGLSPSTPAENNEGDNDTNGAHDADSAHDRIMELLNQAGFTSVVATNCEQEYFRDLHPGDRLSRRSVIESVSEEKSTGLGVGHFMTTRSDFVDGSGDVVATMMFRILKFRPPVPPGSSAPPASSSESGVAQESADRELRPRPSITQDNAFFFEGARNHQLLIQRCASCLTLRHPPQPACARCGSFDSDTVVASGRGRVYSFVVNHYPQVPAFDYPLVVALIELEEGTRLVSNLVGTAPQDVAVGLAVQVEFTRFDDALTLPQFRAMSEQPQEAGHASGDDEAGHASQSKESAHVIA